MYECGYMIIDFAEGGNEGGIEESGWQNRAE